MPVEAWCFRAEGEAVTVRRAEPKGPQYRAIALRAMQDWE